MTLGARDAVLSNDVYFETAFAFCGMFTCNVIVGGCGRKTGGSAEARGVLIN